MNQRTFKYLALALVMSTVAEVRSQPVQQLGIIDSWDANDDGSAEVVYRCDASGTVEPPESWQVGYSIEPWGGSRIVRASSSAVAFRHGAIIDFSTQAFTNYLASPPRPPLEFYQIAILTFRADKHADWIYSTLIPAFEGEIELLIGLRLALPTGFHHGWLKLARPVMDSHTPFDLVAYAVHPVPGEPIAAGEPAPLPPLQVQFTGESPVFVWDARWGNLALDSTRSLAPPVVWEEIAIAAGGPLAVPVSGEEERYFRIRQP